MSEPEKISADAITPLDMPTPTVEAKPVEAPAPVTPPPSPDAEKDDGGVPFDPARHIHHKNRHTGRWMPKGGRKPGSKAAPAPAPAPQPQSFIPSTEPAAPKEEAAAKPAAAASAVSGAAGPGETVTDHSSDAGEVASRAIQFTAGVILKAPEDCTAAPVEHKHMVNATAAYIRSKGWQTTAGIGLLLMFAAWLLKVMQKPKPQETVRSWFNGTGLDSARDVTPDNNKRAGGAQPGHSAVIDLPANIPPLAKL